MVKVFSSINRIAVDQRRVLLESRGIACEINNEYQAPESLGPHAWAELWILDDSRRDEARRLIADFGSESESQAPTWRCQNCDEQVEDHFGECWKCRAARPSADT